MGDTAIVQVNNDSSFDDSTVEVLKKKEIDEMGYILKIGFLVD